MRDKTVLRWSEDEEKVLTLMVEAGKSPREICKVLKDRSEDAVRNKAYKMGLVFRYEPKIDWDALAELGITEI